MEKSLPGILQQEKRSGKGKGSVGKRQQNLHRTMRESSWSLTSCTGNWKCRSLSDFPAMKRQKEIFMQRDDLMIEYVTLLNLSGHYKEAYDFIMAHRFHPWEGGEGKVTTSIRPLSWSSESGNRKRALERGKEILEKALVYPGEPRGRKAGRNEGQPHPLLSRTCKKSISGRTRRRRKSMRQLRSERMNRLRNDVLQ